MEIIFLISFWIFVFVSEPISEVIIFFKYLIPVAILIAILQSICRYIIRKNKKFNNEFNNMTPEEKKKAEIKEWSRRNRC